MNKLRNKYKSQMKVLSYKKMASMGIITLIHSVATATK